MTALSVQPINSPRRAIHDQGSSVSSSRQAFVIGDSSAVTEFAQSALDLNNLQACALTHEQALIRLQKGNAPDIILMHVAGGHELEPLRALCQARPSVPIIVFSYVYDTQSVVRAMRMGAVDYFQLPLDIEGLNASLRHILAGAGNEEERVQTHETPLFENTSFVSASTRMNELRGQCAILARVDLPLLILGESGTGKEIIAQYIHKMSPRSHRTFLKVNCAAMPADLLESELFGYEKGAFTGAVCSKPGKFEICNMGTILLDEIGEMPPQLQSKLLQVLQDGTFSRLGGRAPIKVDVRVVAATNIDINSAIAARTFREDLYYRLNGFTIQMPPLRDRKEEIPVMVRHFMRKLADKYAKQPLSMSDQLLQAFMEYSWPGNLRELENYVKRFLVLGNEQHILAELRNAQVNRAMATSQTEPGIDASRGLKMLGKTAMGEAETKVMDEVLQRHGWNRKKAAAELQISYKALLYKIRQYGLNPPQYSDQESVAAKEPLHSYPAAS